MFSKVRQMRQVGLRRSDFLCDGHRFIDAAIERGACAIVLEDRDHIRSQLPCIVVKDARQAMARMAARFYGEPTARVPLVGITGTNGKTTTTYLVEGILAAAGFPAAVLGTVSYRFGDLEIPAPHTTPESVDLQETLRALLDKGAASIVMEVSSHALEQRRVDGCSFDVGVFTNLTRDHLDYHGDMETYLGAKSRLFSELLAADPIKPRRYAVINTDDPAGPRIADCSAAPVLTYGLGPAAQVTATDVRFTVDGIKAMLCTPAGNVAFHSRLLGRFNLYNILAAAAVGVALGFAPEIIRAGIEEHRTVPGRLERVENARGITVLVDYAHTGDALENVLQTLTELKTGRIITVFGCGGDRDRGKRPIMGAVAGRFSDLAVVTSDNPRTEEPLGIVAEIREGLVTLGAHEYRLADLQAGFGAAGFVTVPDRREAIRLAIGLARPGDIVLLAGKGHEDYQIIGKTKHHFDDREEAAAALGAC
ncbi:MAG: UDP-N-acetylmuramoyl-L-alanyl-D-glutamate--2,6-diaminopimelate ligase [Geobacter sp.]|nr:UDP-N-acetylmuramoyl-L-alanyl-D-glutamate--2,6-diaminopimelate ligase [Geobacter sp.]